MRPQGAGSTLSFSRLPIPSSLLLSLPCRVSSLSLPLNPFAFSKWQLSFLPSSRNFPYPQRQTAQHYLTPLPKSLDPSFRTIAFFSRPSAVVESTCRRSDSLDPSFPTVPGFSSQRPLSFILLSTSTLLSDPLKLFVFRNKYSTVPGRFAFFWLVLFFFPKTVLAYFLLLLRSFSQVNLPFPDAVPIAINRPWV